MEDKKIETEQEKLERQARENFDEWNKRLKNKDKVKVAELYSEGSTFLPTMSGDFVHGENGKNKTEDYFEHFLKKNPAGIIKEQAVQKTGEDTYLHSGMYDFVVGPADKRETVEARFTYVWQKGKDGNWKIIHHHSSVKPSEKKEKVRCPNCGSEF